MRKILINLFNFVKNEKMRERLSKFIEMERLTSSRLAEILGVQPSNISHILGGRNKPSFEFIEKLLLRFPKLNPDWIILGKGPVYRLEITPAVRPAETPEPEANLSLFPDTATTIRSQQHDASEEFLPIPDTQNPTKKNHTASKRPEFMRKILPLGAFIKKTSRLKEISKTSKLSSINIFYL